MNLRSIRFHLLTISLALWAVAGPQLSLSSQEEGSGQPTPAGAEQPNQSAQEEIGANQETALENARKSMLDALDKIVPASISSDANLESELLAAISLFQEQNPSAAQEKLNEIRASNAAMPPTDYLLAGMYLAAGNAGTGIQFLEKAAKQNPGYPSTYSGFARIAINQNRYADAFALTSLAQQLIEQGNWSTEQKNFFRTEVLDAVVDIETTREQWDSALEHLGELRGLVPDNGKVTLKLAQVHFERGEVDKSLENLRLTKKLAEDLRAPEVILADWYLVKKDLEQSKKWIEKAVNDYPTDGNVHLNYARWLLRNNQLPLASETAKRAEDLGADKYQTTFVRGQVAFTRRDYDVAEMYFSRLNQFKPGDVEASNLLTLSLIESNDQQKLDKATQLASMNARMYPQNTVILATLGWVLLKTGKSEQSKQVFQQLVNVRPLPAATGYFLATLLAENDDVKNAKRFLEASLKNDGYFMYRSAAQELMRELEKRADDESADNGAGDNGAADSGGDGGQSVENSDGDN